MKPEPFNPFYWLLVLASIAFVITALPIAISLAGVPMEAPAWFRDHDWKILLAEVAAIIVFGLLSMGLDRIYRWRNTAVADNKSLTKPPQPAISSVPEP